MARHKAIDTNPKFLAVDLEKQLLQWSTQAIFRNLSD